MASRRLGGVLLLGCAALLIAPAVHADPTAADRETARSLMQQGRELRDKGELRGALARFKAADEIMLVPTTALEVARAQIALGLLVEARDTIAANRQRPAKRTDPAPFTEARAKAEDLDTSLNGRVPSLTVSVQGVANGEQPTVAIDDVRLSATAAGLPRSVDPGHHVVTAKTATGEGRQELDIREGEQKKIEVTLVPTAVVPVAPAVPEAPTDAPQEPPAPTTSRSHSAGALTWAGIGLAGAGVIAGSVTGLLSMSKKSTLAGECPNKVCGPSSYSDFDSATSLATVSDVAFAVAGAGAVLVLVSLIVGHEVTTEPAPAEPPAALRVVPWLGPGSAGLRGTF
jgi:hypothetical protein